MNPEQTAPKWPSIFAIQSTISAYERADDKSRDWCKRTGVSEYIVLTALNPVPGVILLISGCITLTP